MTSPANHLPHAPSFARRLRALLGLASCLGAAVVFFAACGGPDPVIFASAYNQSCAQDSDCAPVNEGEITCCTTCNGNTAINKADLARFTADRKEREPSCSNVACPDIACAPVFGICQSGKCGITQCGDEMAPKPCTK